MLSLQKKVVLLWCFAVVPGAAFVASPPKRGAPSGFSMTETGMTPTQEVEGIKQKLNELISSTDRGRSCSKEQQVEIEQWLEKLDGLSRFKEPNRSSLTGGKWIVQYTTAPPPSNGMLGPFKGESQQEIDMLKGTYNNILVVPPNDWLSAVLDATWEEWDGDFLPDQDGNIPTQEKKEQNLELGGTCWKVTFECLRIKLFGFPVITQMFENVQRIWRTTYLDETSRVVRAGRTGAIDEEMIFYMTRA